MKSKTFVLNEKTLELVLTTINQVRHDGSVQVTLSPVKNKRSLSQNSLLWLWLKEIAIAYEDAFGEMFSPDTFHQYFKRLFLGQEAVEINGNTFVKMKSTTKLSTKDMVDYMERIELWAGKELELQLSHPEDLWLEAMSK